MRYRAVNVYLGARQRLVGVLFQYGTGATALLHKFELERTDPNPGRSYAMAVTHTVVGRPSCVKRLSTATRTCNSTT